MAQVGSPWLIRTLIADGLMHYSYNEVAFMALNKVRARQGGGGANSPKSAPADSFSGNACFREPELENHIRGIHLHAHRRCF